MNENKVSYSLQDYALIKTHVDKLTTDLKIKNASLGFYFFVLDLLFNLQEDEIDDAITDTAYLQIKGKVGGHDRGIDAIYIDESEDPPIVHLFNFKYTEQFNKTKRNFPSNEIDKILSIITDIIEQRDNVQDTVNEVLYSKIEDIWALFANCNPRFVIHICANYYHGLESAEQKRFEKSVDRFSKFEIKYHLMPELVSFLTKKNKQVVNARVRAIDQNLFEKSDGDVRALIVDLDVRDLLRMVVDDEQIRQDVDIDDYLTLQKCSILEDAFDDNVRVYLKQRSKINRNIKETALSDEAHRFFYFNNGITITCSHFDYPKQRRNPIIEVENLQIVNGGQTVHALFEAFKEKPNNFEHMDVLCRIYETRNERLSTNIAEYTNSQNPVNSRDIRSNDFVQRKLESELEALGYFYERKKGQYADKPKEKRIDAEKAGQALMAFYNKMPAEAKNKKGLIFAEKYNDVFSDEITADAVLLATRLFNEVEKRKKERKREILDNIDKYDYESESYILHATYYILYVLSEMSDLRDINKTWKEYSNIIAMYDDATEAIKQAVDSEQKSLEGYAEDYTHRKFFISNRPKLYLEKLLKNVVVSTNKLGRQ